MKLRRLRDSDVLEDGDVVLVRGGDLDPDVLGVDATRYHSIYGVSVFAVRDATLDELAQQVPLVRFDRPALPPGQGRPCRRDEAGADWPQPAPLHRRLRRPGQRRAATCQLPAPGRAERRPRRVT